MCNRTPRSINHMGGAALTEFAVLGSVMVSVMFAIPMLGDLVDAKQTSIQAGRYALWQSTVVPGVDLDPRVVQDRFFGRSDTAISSQVIDAGTHALWGNQGSSASTLGSEAALTLDTSSLWVESAVHADDEGLDVSKGVGEAISAAGNAIGTLSGNDWGIGKTALTRTRVGIAINGNDWLSSDNEHSACGGFGCLTEGGAILVDGWSARSDAAAKERVQAIVPASALEPVGNIISAFRAIPVLKEFRGIKDMFGHVDMHQLPEHANRGLSRYVEDE